MSDKQSLKKLIQDSKKTKSLDLSFNDLTEIPAEGKTEKEISRTILWSLFVHLKFDLLFIWLFFFSKSIEKEKSIQKKKSQNILLISHC